MENENGRIYPEELMKKEIKRLEENLKLGTFLTKTVYEDVEWCFQFDNGEPHVIGGAGNKVPQSDKKLVLTITNDSLSNFIFCENGKTFKIFAREKNNERNNLRL